MIGVCSLVCLMISLKKCCQNIGEQENKSVCLQGEKNVRKNV